MSSHYGDPSEDLSAILMRVIRTLSESNSEAQREEEKRKLDHQFRQSDQKLDSLVLRHQKELTGVMQLYARVNGRLTLCRTRVKDVKARLVSCKDLLRYKRDELKKLWLDGVEQKYVLELLDRIEKLKESPDTIASLLAKQEYLEATHLLVSSLNHLYGDLQNVDGLVEVKEILDAKKEKFYENLMEDLTKQLYIESTWDTLHLSRSQGSFRNSFRRSGSERGSSGRTGGKIGGSSGYRTRSADNSGASGNRRKHHAGRRNGGLVLDGAGGRGAARRLFTEPGGGAASTQFKLLTLAEEEELHQVLKNPKLADLSRGPYHAIVVIVECLVLLNKLPEAIDQLKSQLLTELQGVIGRTTQLLIESGPHPQGDDRLLPELFTAVVDQFGCVIDVFKVFSLASSMAMERHPPPYNAARTGDQAIGSGSRMDVGEVWAKVQTAIQIMLTDYLDFNSSKSAALQHQQNASNASGCGVVGSVSDSAANIADINSYFVRRKAQKPKRETLFRFDYSSTAISMNDYLMELKANKGNKEKLMVCSPNPHNITPIYSSLMDFVSVVETALKCDHGTHCTLYAFLMEYIKDVFLGQIRTDNGNALNAASLSLDSWKSITDSDLLKQLKVHRPLLQSAVGVKSSIDTLSKYMRTLPLYCEHFLTMICNMVMQYKEICNAAYRGVVQQENEDKRIISAQWAKDEDIARFLKSLPNWQAVQRASGESNSVSMTVVAESESPQEAEHRNAQEINMLKGNLGETDIPAHEILYDANQLRSLAQLQESLEWFASNILALGKEFQQSNRSTFGDLPKLPDNSIQTLISLAREFEEISHTCLLVLHLEVRVHCFHYLHPVWRGPAGAHFSGGPDSTDPNPEVVRLAKDLSHIEEALSGCRLQECKIRYVFEGVSHLIASVLMSAAADNIRKMNANGVKKMCRNIFTVQHTLTSSITGIRETALDHAKQYYELLNLRPHEVLSGIVERGPVYTLEEYAAILRLLNRSDPNSTANNLSVNLEKLKDIMKQVGVRV